MKNCLLLSLFGLTFLTSFITITHAQQQSLIPNIVFLGATGNGKSTVCNAICGEKPDPFLVGHTSLAATERVFAHLCEAKSIKVVDTPGFGDNRFDEKQVDSMIKDFTKVIVESIDSSLQIDAIVLVERLTPRASTLKSDLEHLRQIFGNKVFKSLVVLVMPDDNKQKEADGFFEELKKMNEVINIITQGSTTQRSIEDHFVLWHNKNPRRGQEWEFFQKLGKVEPYTHRRFIEAADEVKEMIRKRFKEEIKKEALIISQDYAEQPEVLNAKLQEMQDKLKKMEYELIEEREKATKSAIEGDKIIESKRFNYGKLIGSVAGALYGGPIWSAVGFITGWIFDGEL